MPSEATQRQTQHNLRSPLHKNVQLASTWEEMIRQSQSEDRSVNQLDCVLMNHQYHKRPREKERKKDREPFRLKIKET